MKPDIIEIFTFRTSTPGNSRKHWTVHAGEAKDQRSQVCNRLKSQDLPAFPPSLIKITRVSNRRVDRWNLHGALKHVIDGIADAFGVDDSDERWNIECEQEKVDAGLHGVVITISREVAP